MEHKIKIQIGISVMEFSIINKFLNGMLSEDEDEILKNFLKEVADSTYKKATDYEMLGTIFTDEYENSKEIKG